MWAPLLRTTPDATYVEIVEIPTHPFFLGCQFHPEFKSKPLGPHSLFREFVAASYNNRKTLITLGETPQVAVPARVGRTRLQQDRTTLPQDDGRASNRQRKPDTDVREDRYISNLLVVERERSRFGDDVPLLVINRTEY